MRKGFSQLITFVYIILPNPEESFVSNAESSWIELCKQLRVWLMLFTKQRGEWILNNWFFLYFLVLIDKLAE